MAKAIYCLKIFLFCNEFNLSAEEYLAISDICTFIIRIYTKAWFTAPLAAKAPNHDFQFLKKIVGYEIIDSAISTAAISKFKNHLWYLSPEAIAMAFFDNSLSTDSKRKMVEALYWESDKDEDDEESNKERIRRVVIKTEEISELIDKGLNYFVSSQTKLFFDRFNINMKFLETNPSTWAENDDFRKGLEIVEKLKVVNDIAERGVKLIQDYNKCLTTNEDQKQFILQIISDYRRRFPGSKRETVSQPL